MKFLGTHLSVNNHCVTDDGSRGRCDGCKGVYGETALFDGRVYCRKCMSQKFPENKTAKFEATDAKFKCPPKKCDADQLTCAEFYIGTCCEQASLWTQDNFKFQRLEIVSTIHKEARQEEGKAELKAETAEKKVKNCRVALESAEKEEKESHDEFEKKKKLRKTVQKRVLFLTKIAAEEDNSDLEENNSPEPRNEANESAEESCKVCFEKFGEDDRQKAAIFPCGHQACFGCLSSLPQKSCPTCRADFTEDKILKLFP